MPITVQIDQPDHLSAERINEIRTELEKRINININNLKKRPGFSGIFSLLPNKKLEKICKIFIAFIIIAMQDDAQPGRPFTAEKYQQACVEINALKQTLAQHANINTTPFITKFFSLCSQHELACYIPTLITDTGDFFPKFLRRFIESDAALLLAALVAPRKTGLAIDSINSQTKTATLAAEQLGCSTLTDSIAELNPAKVITRCNLHAAADLLKELKNRGCITIDKDQLTITLENNPGAIAPLRALLNAAFPEAPFTCEGETSLVCQEANGFFDLYTDTPTIPRAKKGNTLGDQLQPAEAAAAAVPVVDGQPEVKQLLDILAVLQGVSLPKGSHPPTTTPICHHLATGVSTCQRLADLRTQQRPPATQLLTATLAESLLQYKSEIGRGIILEYLPDVIKSLLNPLITNRKITELTLQKVNDTIPKLSEIVTEETIHNIFYIIVFTPNFPQNDPTETLAPLTAALISHYLAAYIISACADNSIPPFPNAGDQISFFLERIFPVMKYQPGQDIADMHTRIFNQCLARCKEKGIDYLTQAHHAIMKSLFEQHSPDYLTALQNLLPRMSKEEYLSTINTTVDTIMERVLGSIQQPTTTQPQQIQSLLFYVPQTDKTIETQLSKFGVDSKQYPNVVNYLLNFVLPKDREAQMQKIADLIIREKSIDSSTDQETIQALILSLEEPQQTTAPTN